MRRWCRWCRRGRETWPLCRICRCDRGWFICWCSTTMVLRRNLHNYRTCTRIIRDHNSVLCKLMSTSSFYVVHVQKSKTNCVVICASGWLGYQPNHQVCPLVQEMAVMLCSHLQSLASCEICWPFAALALSRLLVLPVILAFWCILLSLITLLICLGYVVDVSILLF